MVSVIFLNRYTVVGLLLMILGFLLLPFLVGLVIMPVGIILLLFGFSYTVWSLLPEMLQARVKTFAGRYIDSSPILTIIFSRKRHVPGTLNDSQGIVKRDAQIIAFKKGYEDSTRYSSL